MIVSKRSKLRQLYGKYTDIAAAPVLSREVRYFNDGRELPFSLTIESATHRVRVELSLEEAEQVARDVAEFHARQQSQS